MAMSLAAIFAVFIFIQVTTPSQTTVAIDSGEEDLVADTERASASARETSQSHAGITITNTTSQRERSTKGISTKKQKIPYHRDNIWAPSVKEGSFEIPSSMPTLPTITCDYRIPLDDSGRAMMTAHDLVLLFPFPSEKQAIKGIAKDLTTKWGFSTLSLRFPGFAAGTTVMGDDRERFYYYPESGAGQAWIDAIEKVREIGGLEERPVIVTGRSGGGSAAGLFADAYPDLVCALANEAGRVFSDESLFKGPTLMMYGAHDYVVPPIEAWLMNAKSEGVDVLSYTFSGQWGRRGVSGNWLHPIHGEATKAFLHWIIDIADMRIEHGRIPHSSTWPIQDNGRIYSSEKFKGNIDKMVGRALITESAGVVKLVVDPAPAQVPLGSIVMVVVEDGFSPNAVDVQLFAEQIADSGLRCIALVLDDASHAQAAIIELSLSNDSYAKLPTLLLTKNIKLMQDIVDADIHQWTGAIMIRPRRDLLQAVCESCAERDMHIQVIATEQQMPWVKKTVDASLDVQWSAISKPRNREYWHRDCNNAAVAMAKRWAQSQARR